VTILVWIVIGAVIGAAAMLIQRVETLAGRALNIGAGIAGAIAGGIAAGRGDIGDDPWRTTALIVAAASALILVGIVNLFRHRPAA
jgi:uncharacterized membrane protein YeaQ/YmgE (transglycosylase-associated protein family)